MGVSTTYVTMAEVGARLGMTTKGASYLCYSGKLHGTKERLGAMTGYYGPGAPLAWFTTAEDLADFIAARAAQQAARAAERAGPNPLTPYQERQSAARQGYGTPTREEKRAGYPILKAITAYYSLDRATLEGPSRDHLVTEARRVAAYMLATRAHLSRSAIGHLLRRDRSTIIFHIHKMEQRPTADERAALADIVAQMVRDTHGQATAS